MNILDYALDINYVTNNRTKGFTWELTRLIEKEADKEDFVELTLSILKELTYKTEEYIQKEFELENAKSEGYDYGSEEGYHEGYDEGYHEGREDGYDTGYGEGYEYGKEQGYTEGYNNGYEKGIQEKL